MDIIDVGPANPNTSKHYSSSSRNSYPHPTDNLGNLRYTTLRKDGTVPGHIRHIAVFIHEKGTAEYDGHSWSVKHD